MDQLRALLLGLLAGGLAGSIVLIFSPFTGPLAVLAAILGASVRPRPWGLPGMLVGLGVGMAVMLWRADQACRPAECVGPDLGPWFAASAFLIASGGAIVLALVLRGTRSRT